MDPRFKITDEDGNEVTVTFRNVDWSRRRANWEAQPPGKVLSQPYVLQKNIVEVQVGSGLAEDVVLVVEELSQPLRTKVMSLDAIFIALPVMGVGDRGEGILYPQGTKSMTAGPVKWQRL